MATISGILNNLRKANQRIESNTTEINNVKQDYVAKDGNATPVTENVAWEVTNTGALQSTETKRNVATGEISTVTQTPIPVVDTAARLIQPAEIQKINQLNQWYEINNNGNALNYAVDLTDIPNSGNANEAAVQTYLTAKFNAAGNTTGNPTQDLVMLVDNDTGAKYVWYVNSAAWVQSNSATGAQATNETHDPVTNAVTRLGTKGVIMGSDIKGKIFVEVDGTASLVGYDEMVTNIANNAAAAAAKYTKPNTGIPSDDMTDEVKESLQKADCALQSVPDATNTVKGIATLGATGGAARYGEKADVGLDNVDNTSDADKPVSNAMQAALNAKQNNLSETQIANIADVPNKEPAFSKNTAFNKNFGHEADTVCEGNDSRLSDARPASDVPDWAKAEDKPTYTATEVGAIPLAGSSNITGALTPKTNGGVNLGGSSSRWNYVYCNYLSKGSYTLTVPSKSGTIATTGDIPSVPNLYPSTMSAGSSYTGQFDTVQSYYINSSGSQWYRTWRSGWKECGIKVSNVSTSWQNYTLPVTFTNISYMHVTISPFAQGDYTPACQPVDETHVKCRTYGGTLENAYVIVTGY